MMTPPAAATIPLTPGPVPPPVAGAPTGWPVLVAAGVPVETPVGTALAVPVGLLVALAMPVGKLVCEPVGEGEHEAEAVALADGDGVAVPVVLGVADAVLEGEALVVGVQLVAGDGLQLGLGLAVLLADDDGVAVAVVLGVAEAVAVLAGAQLDVSATATPPNGPVNAASASETNRVTVPVARPTSPALCSFSQPLCRDRRKIVTIPWVGQLSTPR
ncbi:MAG: hypothetical protein ACRDN1_14110 [Trebonia sp.]